MNEKFYELPLEKQIRILNAGFEVFSMHEYKHASTDVMSKKADISKGLLFYYFKNKKTFYLYLVDYAIEIGINEIIDDEFSTITDFFELCIYASHKKVELLIKYPYLMEFLMRAYYGESHEIAEDLNKKISSYMSSIFADYFKNIDFSSFKEEYNPYEILSMLTWMADGYMHQYIKQGKRFEISSMMKEYMKWCDMLKKAVYKNV